MKHFNPSDITNDNCAGYTIRQVVETLRHYGFIIHHGGKHLQVKHREYPMDELRATDALKRLSADGATPFTMGVHGKDAPPKIVVKAAAYCLAVKELNQERRDEEKIAPLPTWLGGVIPPSFSAEEEDHVLRLMREPTDSPRRSYRIKNKKGHLEVVNLNFPEQFHFDFTLRGGDKNPNTSFKAMFQALDAQVVSHLEEWEKTFQNRLDRLLKNRGLSMTEDDEAHTDFPMVHLQHPADSALAYAFEKSNKFETIANETFDALAAADEASEALWEAWERNIETLKQAGWQVERVSYQTKPSELEHEATRRVRVVVGEAWGKGEARPSGTMKLSSPHGAVYLEEPVYGELTIGNPEAIAPYVAQVPERVVQGGGFVADRTAAQSPMMG